MLFSYKWLKEYVKDLPSPKAAADRLTMSGTEVEAVYETSGGITGVVTAEIVSRERHPNADRLSLCEVKTDKEIFHIVCGATNMKAGDRVALALPGAELPGGFKIKKSKIRGVESCGMMCSEKELGLKDSSEGIWILPEDTPLGVDLREAMGLDDAMLEVSITPNRADLLSIKGLARELAALTGAAFTEKEIKAVETGAPIEKKVAITVENGAPCARYTARVIEGVKAGPSPEFIKRRLEAAGIRAVGNVVDITNYVLLELGQPLHAFDLDKISDRRIIVRLAKEGEQIETIDNKTRQLSPDMLVIADGVSPVAIAGVMGGKGTEVSDATVNILLECAFFDPSTVRRQSRKLGLSSDSSYRFERGVDIDGVLRALDMAAGMMMDYCGGTIARDVIDLYPQRFENPVVQFRLKRAAALLGVTIGKDAAIKMFKSLGMDVREPLPDTQGGHLEVTAPAYRVDIKNETDLIEETARIFGYDKITAVMPVVRMTGGVELLQGAQPLEGALGRHTLIRKKINGILTATGFSEVVNYSFVSPALFSIAQGHGDGVRLINPLSEEQSVMRADLLPSLLMNLQQNLFHKSEEARIFEFAPVFLPGAKGSALPLEKWKISGLMYGRRVQWNGVKESCRPQPLDFYEVKGVVETLLEGIGVGGVLRFERMDMPEYAHLFHPGKSAVVTTGGKGLNPFKPCGVFGQTHPDMNARFELKSPAFLFELDVDALIGASAGVKKYRPLPKFPESSRDIAFIVNVDVPYGDILNAIISLDTKLIENVELFDIYCGGNIQQGMRSMAIRIRYRSLEGTLKQEEVEEVHAKVGKIIAENFNAVIRTGQ